ncbi:MAG: N-acetylmuramoyl-L-alanine amidase [Saprospiraceae bacterium]|nr:N-acetylmuramoyl-L-alanine amidase [Saprospiraceae bacterium]
MKTQNHLLHPSTDKEKISFKESPNHSGEFKENLPDTIVIHYTAGSSLQSSANWLTNPKAKASAHLIVGKSGEIVQLVPFNKISWHAGKSDWKGRSGLNNYSIGIEIDNAGILEKRIDGYYTWFGKKVDDNKVVLAKHKDQQTEKAWEAYTDKQIEAVENICLCLKDEYNITEIVGHDDIAPKRKSDPGPAFQMQKLKDKILYGRKDEVIDDIPETNLTEVIVTADLLNIRTKPSADAATVTSPLAKGTKLKVMEIDGNWSKVKLETEGWVSSKYLKTL